MCGIKVVTNRKKEEGNVISLEELGARALFLDVQEFLEVSSRWSCVRACVKLRVLRDAMLQAEPPAPRSSRVRMPLSTPTFPFPYAPTPSYNGGKWQFWKSRNGRGGGGKVCTRRLKMQAQKRASE